ncbi:MAG: hypothetical protein QM537_00140 [Candidatus Symbiobacter sp.]|nr:hypothetical protein [Candidatus Symbiobacter sp.]
MKLNDIGGIAAWVIVLTFLVIAADKMGVIKLRSDPPVATAAAPVKK